MGYLGYKLHPTKHCVPLKVLGLGVMGFEMLSSLVHGNASHRLATLDGLTG